MKNIYFLYHLITNPILWTKTSESFWQILTRYTKKTDSIIEIGCGTAHVSFTLARSGYSMVLNELRKDSLEVAQKQFQKYRVEAQYLPGNLFSLHQSFDLAWNSGLIQCFKDKEKEKFVKKLAKIATKVILFYPDTDSPLKKRGNNMNKIAGVDDAKEYSVSKVPIIMNKHFQLVHFGTLSANEIGLPYSMYWIYGENS